MKKSLCYKAIRARHCLSVIILFFSVAAASAQAIETYDLEIEIQKQADVPVFSLNGVIQVRIVSKSDQTVELAPETLSMFLRLYRYPTDIADEEELTGHFPISVIKTSEPVQGARHLAKGGSFSFEIPFRQIIWVGDDSRSSFITEYENGFFKTPFGRYYLSLTIGAPRGTVSFADAFQNKKAVLATQFESNKLLIALCSAC
jgi:hypothetical protein